MRRAFSLTELLVVMAIMALLAGLILAGANAIGIGSKKSKTGSILAALRSGLDLAQASTGTTFSPVEHPLAGSRPQRAVFVGIRGRTWDAVSDTAIGGTRIASLDRTGEALTGLAEWELGDPVTDLASRKRLLMDDDRFADTGLPLLYGLERSACRILGAEFSATTRYRSLPKPRPPSLRLTAPSFTSADFPDARYLVAAGASASDSEANLGRLLDASGVHSQLVELKALRTAPDDLPANRILPPTPLGAGADDGGRVWSPEPDPKDGNDHWEPGRVLAGVIDQGPSAGQPDWKTYQLRGMAIYDAWGREILCRFSSSGGLLLLSAGPDGCMRWNPGSDHVFQTAADASAQLGDDLDGSLDNVSDGGR